MYAKVLGMNVSKRLLCVVFIAGAISACNATPEKSIVEVECNDPRPQICTMIYLPVCGLDNAGESKTYSSGCNACSHPEVVGYNNNACEDLADKKEH